MASGTLEPLLAADLDIANMFGNVEWPCIRSALRSHFLEASAWTEWRRQSHSVTTLPTVGTIQSALVLSEAPETHLQDFSFEHKGVCDELFVDDRHCFVRSWAFDGWLRALDVSHMVTSRAPLGC